ncbi:hypothetical protein KOW79_014587 [Hemibagrus wyckioides]|uniref:Uncharacterized protein n=1 Tax=Hemibagrus wyckioides TaxID=337641 RepID=A0A9D3NG07_9TELE|nr:hypothetical protein KOW79_014587 [Hemibagrus wyckioides]
MSGPDKPPSPMRPDWAALSQRLRHDRDRGFTRPALPRCTGSCRTGQSAPRLSHAAVPRVQLTAASLRSAVQYGGAALIMIPNLQSAQSTHSI